MCASHYLQGGGEHTETNNVANPQKENGHIDIANEIAEALARTNLNGYENRYLWVLWRKTYGWHKKEDLITNSQFSDLTGIKRPHIWRTERALIKRNIVTKLGNKVAFQKDYTQWRELPKMVTVTKLGTTVTKLGNKKLPKMVHTKETTKETITKETSNDVVEIIDAFKDVNPSYRKWFANTTQRKSVENLLSIHGKDRLLAVIRFLPQSNIIPFVPTITSPYVLEERWADLQAGLIKIKNKQITNQPKVIF